MYRNYWATVLFGVLLASCGGDETVVIGGESNEGDAETESDTGGAGIPGDVSNVQPGCNKMDILFVIDDSGSMSDEQANLGVNFPQFFNILNEYETNIGEPLDYRVGFTTTGVTKSIEASDPGSEPRIFQQGADGALVNGSCNEDIGWFSRDTENADELFTCVSDIGINGPVVEMPLEAIRLSIGAQYNNGSTSDFYREDALLGIVILTDEDDCSKKESVISTSTCNDTFPTEAYVASLDQFKTSRAKWAVAVVAGEISGCESQWGRADPTPRLNQFAQQTGENAVQSSICDQDLSIGLNAALDTFDVACENFPGVE